jgi:hypothetical protein
LTLPVPVNANLFFAPEFVFTFGIVFKFKLLLIIGDYAYTGRATFFYLLFFIFCQLLERIGADFCIG